MCKIHLISPLILAPSSSPSLPFSVLMGQLLGSSTEAIIKQNTKWTQFQKENTNNFNIYNERVLLSFLCVSLGHLDRLFTAIIESINSKLQARM